MAPEQETPEGRLIGKITHYFGQIRVGIIELSDTLRVGDTIRIKGATTDITQTVDSMQIEHDKVAEAHAGEIVGTKVDDRVRVGDDVFAV
jgi:translation elongation factor EF-1alpha